MCSTNRKFTSSLITCSSFYDRNTCVIFIEASLAVLVVFDSIGS
jgi:hypothetical protein